MANNIVKFSRNRQTFVEAAADDLLISTCRLQDVFTTAEVRLTVRLPGLEIEEAVGSWRHEYWLPVADIDARLAKLRGVRVGSGMLKIIRGLVGEEEHLAGLVYMVEECCHGVILSLTRKVLLSAPDDRAGRERFYADMVKKSIRLYDRCAAFAKGSPLVRELEAERGETGSA
ncbi:MAG: hypothetical protein JW781_09300 [Deltaproteobacteria bacterium]|nr:hypothetical protein [Candidatus Anaeroferrophillacea bacterium]